jgi:hypothetical protein
MMSKEELSKLSRGQRRRYYKNLNKTKVYEKVGGKQPEKVESKQETKNKPKGKNPKKPLSPAKKEIVRREGGLKPVKQDLSVTSVSTSVVRTDVVMNQGAFVNAGLGIASILAARADTVGDDIYGFYFAFLTNLFTAIQGETPLIKQDVMYIEAILNGLRPKNIRDIYGSKHFSWADFTPGAPAKQIPVRGYNYNFYKPAPADPLNAPQPCVPMNISNIEEALSAYTDIVALLADERPHTQMKDYDSVQVFKYDVSCFAAESPYIGSGNSTGSSMYSSVELEVPGVALPMMGHWTEFASPSPRVANFFRNGSGDTTALFAMPLVKDFKFDHLKTVHPVRYKFLYFEEVYTMVTWWLAESYSKASHKGANLLGIPPIALGAVIGALRQTLLEYFLSSQACAQFMTYDVPSNKFEPFRVSPNCVPKVGQGMLLPMPLIEMLRCLRLKEFEKTAELKHNEKNVVIYCPVWGINKTNTAWDIPTWFDAEQQQHSLFQDADNVSQNMNWIDGTMNGGVYNLNSKYFQAAITAWNQNVTQISDVCGLTGFLDGTPSCCLLGLTRFYNETEPQFDNLANVPIWYPLPPGFSRVLRKSKSKKDLKDQMEVWEVVKDPETGGNVVLKQLVPDRCTSISPITEEIRNILDYLILPAIVNTEDGQLNPSQLDYNKFMICQREAHNVALQTSNDVVLSTKNQYTIDKNNGLLMAPGIAAHGSEYARVVEALTTRGKGGFLSNILGVASQIVGTIESVVGL